MENDILFINACVRPGSRTLRLARRVLSCLEGTVTEVNLEREGLRPLDWEALERREALLAGGEHDHPMLRYARQFAGAGQVVLAAPYWDLSFPASVKTYFEHVTVNGVSFCYDRDGQPCSLTRVRQLCYVMTAGGPILTPNHGYAYVKSLCRTFFNVPDIPLFSAALLDVADIDAERQLTEAEQRIDAYFDNSRPA